MPLALLLIPCLLAGCVTEVVKSNRGVPLGKPVKGAKASSPSQPSTPGGVKTDVVEMPDGPVAQPALGASVTSRVIVSVKPLGMVPFDGAVLPLVSPDGRYLATQVGDAPGWPTLLAQPDEQPPSTRVELFDIASSPVARVPFPDDSGNEPLLLGRGADSQGVLVESPRPDGSRWIGRLEWTGHLRWLVQDGLVNAHATIDARGDVAYSQRDAGETERALVVRTAAGEMLGLRTPGVSYCFPSISADGSTVCAIALTRDAMEIVAVRTGLVGQKPMKAGSLGNIVARRVVSRRPDMGLAYQCFASAQSMAGARTPGADSTTNTTAQPGTLLLFSPAQQRMCVFDPTASELIPLAEGSIAAAPYRMAAGDSFFLTTAKGLMHQRLATRDNKPYALPCSRVLADEYVARATNNLQLPFVLIGPGPKNDPGMLSVVAMGIAGEADEGKLPPAKPK